mmetsp:Transcript_28242/g.62029  ORF Transcript_28242/g.62029 Transcript_28242/m.62029 type:complete len:228 (+) Transcript_28242:403-1086(+)
MLPCTMGVFLPFLVFLRPASVLDAAVDDATDAGAAAAAILSFFLFALFSFCFWNCRSFCLSSRRCCLAFRAKAMATSLFLAAAAAARVLVVDIRRPATTALSMEAMGIVDRLDSSVSVVSHVRNDSHDCCWARRSCWYCSLWMGTEYSSGRADTMFLALMPRCSGLGEVFFRGAASPDRVGDDLFCTWPIESSASATTSLESALEFALESVSEETAAAAGSFDFDFC